MPEISFYILSSDSLPERDLFACKLLEKVYRSGNFGYVLVDDSQQSNHMDALLWTFRPGSFIPHQLYIGEQPNPTDKILIGMLPAPTPWQQTVINLSANCPANFADCGRILEILDNSEAAKTLGRARYRHYQQAGLDITTHKM